MDLRVITVGFDPDNVLTFNSDQLLIVVRQYPVGQEGSSIKYSAPAPQFCHFRYGVASPYQWPYRLMNGADHKLEMGQLVGFQFYSVTKWEFLGI